MASSITEIETYHRGDEMMEVFRNAVREAQAESRRLGVANVYCHEGQIYYELPNGEITWTTPPETVGMLGV